MPAKFAAALAASTGYFTRCDPLAYGIAILHAALDRAGGLTGRVSKLAALGFGRNREVLRRLWIFGFTAEGDGGAR